MGTILLLIALFFGWAIFKAIFSASVRTVGAVGKTVIGDGSFSENMNLAFKGMVDFEVRFKDRRLNEDGTGALIKEIQGRGLFPISHTRNIGFITSVFDKTNGENEPVLSVLDSFQENESVVYQHSTDIGYIDSNQGFVKWVRFGVVIPDLLEPPIGGTRKMCAVIRMVDLDDPPQIIHGFGQEGGAGIIWQRVLEFEHTFEGKGYQEASEHRDEAAGISLRIGMAVAMADGSLDDSEGSVLQNWIIKSIAPHSNEKQARLKELYNTAMRESYDNAVSGNLILSDLTERLNEIGDKATKYEAIELCYEVMAADGVADTEEIKLIRKVAEALNLDIDEVNSLRDQQIVGLNANISDHASIEDLLGIEQDWSASEVKKHLRSEFQKWNNRLNTLSEGDERDNAQLMLDRIAEARKKYA